MENDDKLKQILQNMAAPEPSESAKKAAISNALAEFEYKRKKTTQGSSIISRLINITNQLDRSINMKKFYYYGGSLTAITLVLGVTAVTFMSGNLTNTFSKTGSVMASANGGSSSYSYDNRRAQIAPSPTYAPPQALPVPPPTPMTAQEQMVQSYDSSMIAKKPTASIYSPAPPPAKVSGMVLNKEKATFDNLASAPGELADESNGLSADPISRQQLYEGNDKFEEHKVNPVKLTAEESTSTFSIDVDTSSYSFIRRTLNTGQLPPKDSIRVEEMINYFTYDYALPEDKSQPFKPSVNVIDSPWHKGNKLVHIGIKGYDIAPAEKPHANLVFLIDTSGSMNEPDKLPLLINSFGMLVDTLGKNDTVSIVTYAGSAGTVLEPTKASDKSTILEALGRLQAGGSTAGAEGIKQAYALAEKSFDKEGINRVILATDGDFNVGISDPEELKTYIEKKRETGVFLSVLGFGQGNYNDELMQKLAQNGNGNAAYIDNINEARKVLVDEASSTLFPIAKDVKIQVEFNKARVSEYRLIGYETRILNREDFNNDKVDAGEIGSGHAVTAIYEITPKGSKGLVDEPRYGENKTETDKSIDNVNEYAFLKMRYKLPNGSTSKLLSTPITSNNELKANIASDDVRFSIAVAAFGQMLHGDSYVGDFKFDDVIKLAEGAKGEDKFGYRSEFVNLVRNAKVKSGQTSTQHQADE